MYLEEFYDYKNQLMEDLLTNETIVRLLDEKIPMDKTRELVYSQVFPLEYVPETVQDGKTYICCDVDIQKSSDKTYLYPTLYIWVFAHRSKLVLPSGGVRTDKICSEIARSINGSKMYGLGELELYSVKRFAPMTDYQGKVMTFNAKDFSRVYNANKEVPANRRRK